MSALTTALKVLLGGAQGGAANYVQEQQLAQKNALAQKAAQDARKQGLQDKVYGDIVSQIVKSSMNPGKFTLGGNVDQIGNDLSGLDPTQPDFIPRLGASVGKFKPSSKPKPAGGGGGGNIFGGGGGLFGPAKAPKAAPKKLSL